MLLTSSLASAQSADAGPSWAAMRMFSGAASPSNHSSTPGRSRRGTSAAAQPPLSQSLGMPPVA